MRSRLQGVKLQLLGIALLVLATAGNGDEISALMALLGLFLVFIGLFVPDS